MIRALDIAWKDLKHIVRDLPALALLLAAPLVLTTLIGIAFGGSSGLSVPLTKVAVFNGDRAAETAAQPGAAGAQPGAAGSQPGASSGQAQVDAGSSIVSILKSPALKDILSVQEAASADDARKAVDDGEVAAAVIIPPGLSASVFGDTTTPSKVEVYQEPTLRIGPSVVAGIVQGVAEDFNGAWAAASAAAARQGSGEHGAEVGAAAGEAAARFVAAVQQGPVTLESRAPQVGEGEREPEALPQTLLNMMVFFMFIGAVSAARSILDEDTLGTLPRLFTTPTPRSVILGGKFLSVLAVVLAQGAVLLIVGRLAFSLRFDSIVAGTALLLLGAAASAGMGVLLISLARTPAQAGAIGTGVLLAFALISGNFIGGMTFSGVYATVRKFTPNAWLIDAWGQVLRGAGISALGWTFLVMGGFAVVVFALGTIVFRRRFA